TPLRLKDLAEKAFISLPEDDYPGTRDWLTRVCGEAGFTPNITHESNSTSTLIHLVGLEMGVALLPESCLRLPHEGTVFHPLDEVVYSKTHLLWRKENFSLPLQHYIRIVSDRFEGKQNHKVKALPAMHPEKKLATEGTLKELTARTSGS
ncbi:MAG TPA: LysR family substrate-binding domain-containing protein, partial [Chthoniobacterales bacterium]